MMVYQHLLRLWMPLASIFQLLSVCLKQLLHTLRQVSDVDLSGGASHHFLQAADPLHVVQSLLDLLEAVGVLHAAQVVGSDELRLEKQLVVLRSHAWE